MSEVNGRKGAFTCADQGMHQPGLTKREYMATQIMAGYVANTDLVANFIGEAEMARDVVAAADALLAELEEA